MVSKTHLKSFKESYGYVNIVSPAHFKGSGDFEDKKIVLSYDLLIEEYLNKEDENEQ